MKNKRAKRASNVLTVLAVLLSVFLVTLLIYAAVEAFEVFPSIFDNFSSFETPNTSENKKYDIKYIEYIEDASKEFSVPPETICAVIYAESSFNKDAKSAVGARGLMQIMPATFDDIQKALKTSYTYDDLFDPKVNIRAGTYYLSYLYRYLGDWELAHAAYNAGIGNVLSWMKNDKYYDGESFIKVPFAETESYLKKIENAKQKYRELYFD